MATTPRGKSSARRTTARSKKTATIDLDAKDVKDNSAPISKNAENKPPVTASPAEIKSPNLREKQKPADSQASKNKEASQKKRAVPSVGQKDAAKSTSAKKPTAKPSAEPKTAAKPSAAKPSGANSKSPKPSNNNGGFGKLAAAGIVGGLITLGGAGAMQYSGMMSSFGSGETTSPTPAVNLSPLENKLAAMQAKIDALESAPAQSTSQTGGAAPVDLSTIKERITVLENAPAPLSNGEGSGEVASVELQKLQSAYDGLAAANEALASRLASLENAEPVTTDNSAITALINTAIAPVANSTKQTDSKLEQVEGSIASLTKKIDEEVDARINAFDAKLKNAATGEKLAKSVAINALKSAIENGQPFSAALTSLETLAGTSKPLEKLKPFAANGIATNKQLLGEFHGLQNSILASANNDPDASITDRLMLSLQSLVTVSSDEALPGGSPEAVISRIDANLKSENFGAAISEWRTLPDPAQQLSKAWVDKLNQRMDADRQMYKLMKSLQTSN